MDTQEMSVRKLARTLDISDTNIRNYITRDSKPSSDVIEKLVRSFPGINTAWLITGEGEPFLPGSTSITGGEVNYTGNNYGNNVGSNRGTINQHTNQDATRDFIDPFGYKGKIEKLESENQQLREQLQRADALAAAKDETIALLKAAFNRPS
ncbi:MAG: hypothetical protein ACRYF0_19645 [Janthinobacterium lividum]